MQNLMNKKTMEKYIGQWVYDPSHHYGIVVAYKDDSYGIAFFGQDEIKWTPSILITECPYFLLYKVGDKIIIDEKYNATIEKIHTQEEVFTAKYYNDYEAYPFLAKLNDGDIWPVGIHEIKKVF